MAFVAENPLEEALAQAAVDVLARPRFYQALMSEPLVVAGEIVRKAPDAPPEGMNLAMIRLNGRVFHPVFTSLGRLKKIAPDEQRHFLAIGREFFERTWAAPSCSIRFGVEQGLARQRNRLLARSSAARADAGAHRQRRN